MPTKTKTLDASSLRKTSEQEYFPWKGKTLSWIVIDGAGTVTNPRMVGEKRQALLDAALKKVTLLIAWPGQWSTDTFLADGDLHLVDI